MGSHGIGASGALWLYPASNAGHRLVGAVRAERQISGAMRVKCQLSAEHRRQPGFGGSLREAHHAVEPVVIGQCQRVEAQPHCFVHQLGRARRPVQEAEVGVGVQFRVRHRGDRRPRRGGKLDPLAVHRGCLARAVFGAPALTGPAGWRRPVGQPSFQFPPGNARIRETHGATITNARS